MCALLFGGVMLSAFVGGVAFAQSNDMWIGTFQKKGLYESHPAIGKDGCDTSEAFVEVGSSGLGFCIEKVERSALNWEEARQVCAALEKRLPEPGEFKYACNRAGTLGLTGMTNDFEWASNETTYHVGMWYSGIMQSLNVPIIGGGGCNVVNHGPVGGNPSGSVAVEAQFSYRCVH